MELSDWFRLFRDYKIGKVIPWRAQCGKAFALGTGYKELICIYREFNIFHVVTHDEKEICRCIEWNENMREILVYFEPPIANTIARKSLVLQFPNDHLATEHYYIDASLSLKANDSSNIVVDSRKANGELKQKFVERMNRKIKSSSFFVGKPASAVVALLESSGFKNMDNLSQEEAVKIINQSIEDGKI